MAQTKIQKIFRFAIYSLVGAGVLGVIVFGISNLNNGAVVSAQSEQISSQTIIEDAASSKPETFKTIVGPWYPIIFVLLGILSLSVIIKVLRHPK